MSKHSPTSIRLIRDWLIVEWARGNRSHRVIHAFDHAQTLAREDSEKLGTFIHSELHRRPEDATRPGDRPTTGLLPPVVGPLSATATKEI